NIHNDDVFHGRAYRIPGLAQRDASQDNRIAAHRAGIVVGEVIVANGHGVRRDSWRHIEIGIRHDFRLAAGMNQKTRMAIPLDEKIPQHRSLAWTNLNELAALLK